MRISELEQENRRLKEIEKKYEALLKRDALNHAPGGTPMYTPPAPRPVEPKGMRDWEKNDLPWGTVVDENGYIYDAHGNPHTVEGYKKFIGKGHR